MRSRVANVCMAVLALAIGAGAQCSSFGKTSTCGILGTFDAAENTGYFHIAKKGNRKVMFTSDGYRYWFSAIDNVRLINGDNGLDASGKGHLQLMRIKYAIGQGPSDGFTNTGTSCDGNGMDHRWAWYTREDMQAAGATAAGFFSYCPAIKDIQGSWASPLMGGKPNNEMPFVYGTLSLAANAMQNATTVSSVTQRAKSIFASFRSGVGAFGNIYGYQNVDPYDPHFAASVAADAATYFTGHLNDAALVMFWPGEADEMKGVSNIHPHIGAVVAASNPVVSADADGYNGSYTYTDTTNYAKAALLAFLQGRYVTIGALNTAWGTSYTQWASTGTWGSGTGFMDEDGTHIANWTMPACTSSNGGYGSGCINGVNSHTWGNNSTQWQDLSDFATLFVRQYYTVWTSALRGISGWHYMLAGTLHYDEPYDYALCGMTDGTSNQFCAGGVRGGHPLVDVTYQFGSGMAASDHVYKITGVPVIFSYNLQPATADSPLALTGSVDTIVQTNNICPPSSSQPGVTITCNSCNIWWNGLTYEYYPQEVALWFSALGTNQTGGVNAGKPWQYFVEGAAGAHSFNVCPYNTGQNGTTADLLANVTVNSTFRRQEYRQISAQVTNPTDYTLMTQAARAAWMSTGSGSIRSSATETYGVLTAVNHAEATTGDEYIVGVSCWELTDSSWAHDNDNAPTNQGCLQTFNGNLINGVENTTSAGSDGQGFTRIPDVSNTTSSHTWGDFLTPFKALSDALAGAISGTGSAVSPGNAFSAGSVVQ